MSRLRAVTSVQDGRDTVGYIRVSFEEYTAEGRPQYSWMVSDGQGVTIEARRDLEGGVREDPDARKATGTLVSFLSHAADVYRAALAEPGRWKEDADLFEPPLMLWAYKYSEALSALSIEFEQSSDLDR